MLYIYIVARPAFRAGAREGLGTRLGYAVRGYELGGWARVFPGHTCISCLMGAIAGMVLDLYSL